MSSEAKRNKYITLKIKPILSNGSSYMLKFITATVNGNHKGKHTEIGMSVSWPTKQHIGHFTWIASPNQRLFSRATNHPQFSKTGTYLIFVKTGIRTISLKTATNLNQE